MEECCGLLELARTGWEEETSTKFPSFSLSCQALGGPTGAEGGFIKSLSLFSLTEDDTTQVSGDILLLTTVLLSWLFRSIFVLGSSTVLQESIEDEITDRVSEVLTVSPFGWLALGYDSGAMNGLESVATLETVSKLVSLRGSVLEVLQVLPGSPDPVFNDGRFIIRGWDLTDALGAATGLDEEVIVDVLRGTGLSNSGFLTAALTVGNFFLIPLLFKWSDLIALSLTASSLALIFSWASVVAVFEVVCVKGVLLELLDLLIVGFSPVKDV